MGEQTAGGDSRVDPETLARLPEFYAPSLSPDGTELALLHDVSGRMELYTVDLASVDPDGDSDLDPDRAAWTRWSDGNVPRNVTGGIAWAPDGDRIYFHRDRDGDEQNDLHAVDRAGETTTVVETDGQAYLAGVDPDGEYLLYAADQGGQLNLYRRDLADDDPAGSDDRRVTAHRRPVWPQRAELSPAGDRVAYVTNETDDPENSDPYVVAVPDDGADADGDSGGDDSGGDDPTDDAADDAGADVPDPRRLDVGETGAEAAVGAWFPDGDRLLVGDDTTDRNRVGVYDLRDDSVEWLSDGSAVERPAAVSPDGRLAVALRTREAATVPVVYDLEDGSVRELDLPTGVAGAVGGFEGPFVDDRTMLVAHETGTRRSTVVRYDLRGDDHETVVPADYGAVDPETFVDPEYVTYDSADGLTIGALLYEPDRREPGPAVVKVHGGPTVQSKRRFDLYAQFLVSQGYVVLDPNYRGSTGRGREFRNRIREDWGGMEQVDVRRGAEWLADRDAVDTERIGVFGGSYGGYSAYCQLTMHPGPWAAGVAWVGMTDLLALYEESMPHFRSVLEDQIGDPEERAEFYRERSPIEHVENVSAPVYVIHGENDPRCPISQARRFREALEDRGLEAGEDGDFEYTELGAEGHGSTDADQKVRAFEHVGDFLDRRL